MWHGNYAWSAWPMLAGGILFWGSIISLIAWGIHRATRHPDSGSRHYYGKAPLDHLKERYAKGEITKLQYEEMKHDLMG